MTREQVQLLQHYQLRTTGEPVFVIRAGDEGTGTFVVRRPVQSDGGIIHYTDVFHAEELETTQQATDREIQQIVYREKSMQEAQAQFAATQPKPTLVRAN